MAGILCFQCLGHDSDACPKTDPNTLHHGKLASGDIGLANVKMDAAVTAWKAKHSELVNPLRKRVVRYGGLREDNGCPALKTEENQLKELERLDKMGGNSGGEAAVTQSPADMEGAPAVSEVMHTMFDAVWTEEEGGAAALQHGPDESFLASPPPQIESAQIDPDQVDPTRLERGLLLEGLTKAGVFDGLSPAVMPKISSVVADRVLSRRSTNAASTGRSLALSDGDARSARGHVVQLAKELLSRDLLRPSSEKSNLEKAVASWSNQSSRPAVRALGAIDPNAWKVAVGAEAVAADGTRSCPVTVAGMEGTVVEHYDTALDDQGQLETQTCLLNVVVTVKPGMMVMDLLASMRARAASEMVHIPPIEGREVPALLALIWEIYHDLMQTDHPLDPRVLAFFPPEQLDDVVCRGLQALNGSLTSIVIVRGESSHNSGLSVSSLSVCNDVVGHARKFVPVKQKSDSEFTSWANAARNGKNTIRNLKNRMYNLKNKTRVYNLKTRFFKVAGVISTTWPGYGI